MSFSKKVRLFSKGAMLIALSDEMVAALMRLRNIREDENERGKREYDGKRNITEEKSAQHWWWRESLADCWSSRELQACQCSVGGFKPSVYIFACLTCFKKEEQMGHLLPSFSLLLLSFSF